MSNQSVKKKEMKVSRIAHEKKTVELMIRLYCRKKEKTRFFVPTVKSCFAMRMPVSTVVRLERKRVHAKSAQYIVTSLSCANECDR